MSHTILDTTWLDENEAAAALELPLEVVHRYYERMIAEGKVPVAYYKGAGTPLLNGFALRQLAGLPEPPPTYRPTARGRRR